MGMPRQTSGLRRRRTALFAIAVWILMTGGAESDVVEVVNDLRVSTSSQELVPPLEGSSTADLQQVLGAPTNHDLGSAGADPVQLQSEGDNEDNGEDDEDLSLSDNEHTLAFEDEVEDDPNDVGVSVDVGRRGGTLTTTGSFVLTSAANRAGNDEEEFGEEDNLKSEHRSMFGKAVAKLVAPPPTKKAKLPAPSPTYQSGGCIMKQFCCPYKGWYCTSRMRTQTTVLPTIKTQAQCELHAEKAHTQCKGTMPTIAIYNQKEKSFGSKDCVISVWARWSRCEPTDDGGTDATSQMRYRLVQAIDKSQHKCNPKKHPSQERRDCISCHIVAPVPPSMFAKTKKCSATSLTGADRGGCTSWKQIKCQQTTRNATLGKKCQQITRDRCITCHEGDVLIPISTVRHKDNMDTPVGLCYTFPDWSLDKKVPNLLQMTYGHSVRVTMKAKPAKGELAAKTESFVGEGEAAPELGEAGLVGGGIHNLLSGFAKRVAAAADEAFGAADGEEDLRIGRRLGGKSAKQDQNWRDKNLPSAPQSASNLDSENSALSLGEKVNMGLWRRRRRRRAPTQSPTRSPVDLSAVDLVVQINERDARSRPFSTVELRQFGTIQRVQLPKPGLMREQPKPKPKPKKKPLQTKNQLSVISAGAKEEPAGVDEIPTTTKRRRKNRRQRRRG